MAAMFSLRVVTSDHYLADPIPGLDVTQSEFRGTEVKKVPILRIYGSTPAGQKTCMHVHGVFPYLYVPYDGMDSWERYLRQFAASLDKAINIANNTKSSPQHVHKLSLVKGIPMYGYHAKEQEFIKIYLYNPTSIKKAADLLLAGAVMNKPFQPYEAHIPYQLQLFIDFNLYGMNLINAGAVKFRRKKDDGKKKTRHISTTLSSSPDDSAVGYGENAPCVKKWNENSIPEHLYLPDNVLRQSSSELEVDIVAADILNRLEVDSNIGNNPGLAALWEDEKQRRRDHGEKSQITAPESQDHDAVEMAESEIFHLRRLQEIIEEQKTFIQSEASDSESWENEASQTDIPATPASLVDFHLSQETDSDSVPLSQNSDIVEEEKPIVSLESIQRVLSFSQSFSQPSSSAETGLESSLTGVLALLAKQSSPAASQLSSSQLSALEEQDSIIADVLPNDNLLQKDDDETLEMSQSVWNAGDDASDVEMDSAEEESNQSSTGVDYNLQGMDETWEEDQNSDEDVIPQLDGASDKKPESTRRKKNLAVRGPVLSPEFNRNYQAQNPYGRGHGSDTGYRASNQDTVPFQPLDQDTVPFQPLGNQNPDYSHSWNQDAQNPAVHGNPQQYENWQHNAWQTPVNSPNSAMNHGNYQAYYNHPQSTESNYTYSSYPMHNQQFSPSSSGYDMHSPSYDVNTHSHFSGSPGIGVTTPQDSYQQMMQFANQNIVKHEYANTNQYANSSKNFTHVLSDHPSGQCGANTMSMGSNHGQNLIDETDSFGQLVSSLSSPVTDLATTVTDLDTLQTCISPSSSISRAVSGSDNSQQDLFNSSHDMNKVRSMSLDESSHSECLMDLSDCHGFMPVDYKCVPSNNVCTNMDMSSSFPPSGLTVNEQTNYFSSSAMSGLFNLVSNISDDIMYEPKCNDDIDRHNITKLSLKRSSSYSSAVTDSRLHSATGWSIQSDSQYTDLNNMWNVSDIPPQSETGMPMFSNKMVASRTFGRSSSYQSDQSKPVKPKKTRRRSKTICSQPVPKEAAYTYAFHIPTPVFKRLKLHQSLKKIPNEVKVVRMHPKDARKYSLLKIGREVVGVQKLSSHDILNYGKCHYDTDTIERTNSVANKNVGELPKSPIASPPIGIIASLLFDDDETHNKLPLQQSTTKSMKLEISEQPVLDLGPLDKSDEQIESIKNVENINATDSFTEYVKTATASLEVAQKPTKLESIIEQKIETVVNPHKIKSETKLNIASSAEKPLLVKKETTKSKSFSAAFEQFLMASLPPRDECFQETEKHDHIIDDNYVDNVDNDENVKEKSCETQFGCCEELDKCMDNLDNHCENVIGNSCASKSSCCPEVGKCSVASIEKSTNFVKMPSKLKCTITEPINLESLDWNKNPSSQEEAKLLDCDSYPVVSPITSNHHPDDSVHSCSVKHASSHIIVEDISRSCSPDIEPRHHQDDSVHNCNVKHGSSDIILEDISRSCSPDIAPPITSNHHQDESVHSCVKKGSSDIREDISSSYSRDSTPPITWNYNQDGSVRSCKVKEASSDIIPEDISQSSLDDTPAIAWNYNQYDSVNSGKVNLASSDINPDDISHSCSLDDAPPVTWNYNKDDSVDNCNLKDISPDFNQDDVSHSCNSVDASPIPWNYEQDDLMNNCNAKHSSHSLSKNDVSHSCNSDDACPIPWNYDKDDSVNKFNQKHASHNSQAHGALTLTLNCNQQKSVPICNQKDASLAGNPEDKSQCCNSDVGSHCSNQQTCNTTIATNLSDQEDVHDSFNPQVGQGTLGVEHIHKEDPHDPRQCLDTSSTDNKQNDNAVNVLTLRNNFIVDDVTSSSKDESSPILPQDPGCTTSGVFHDLKTKPAKPDVEMLESEREQLSEAESTMSNAQSRTSSRTSSRKESSDSNECIFEDIFVKQQCNKKRLVKSVSAISENSDSNLELHDMYFDSYTSEIRRKRTAANYSPRAFSHLFKMNSKTESKPTIKGKKKKKPCQKLIPGVHYIIVGKFKGYKSMGVKLKRLKMDIHETISVNEYLEKNLVEKRLMQKATVKALQKFRFRGSSSSNVNHVSDDNSFGEKMDDESSEKKDEDSSGKYMKCVADIQEHNSIDCSSAASSHHEVDHHSSDFVCAYAKESTCPMSVSDLPRHLNSSELGQECLISLHNKPPKISKDFKTKQSSFSRSVSSDEIDQSFESNSEERLGSKCDRSRLSLKKKTSRPKTVDRVQLITTIDKKIFPSSYQTAENIHMFSKDVESDTALATGCASCISGEHSEFDSSNSNDSSSNLSQKCFKLKSGSLQDSSVQNASWPANNANSKHGKKTMRKKLTRNQKLGVAFLSTRRKKKGNKEAGKLMNSLSVLHQATLESLVDKSADTTDANISSETFKISQNTHTKADYISGKICSDGHAENPVYKNNSVDLFETSNSSGSCSDPSIQAYTDKADDYRVTFEDTMYKLALFSPPLSDLGEVSPPVPLSPMELSSDSTNIPPQSANTSFKSIGACLALEKNSTTNCIESIYETPLSSVENQKDVPNSPDFKVHGHSEVNKNSDLSVMKRSINQSNSSFQKDNLNASKSSNVHTPIKTAVVKLSPLLLSDISQFNAHLKEKNSKTFKANPKSPDSVCYSNKNLKSIKSDDGSVLLASSDHKVLQEIDLEARQISNTSVPSSFVNPLTDDLNQNFDDVNVMEKRQNEESHFSGETGYKCTNITSVAHTSWLPHSDCSKPELLYDPYSNPLKDPQYDDISSDEDTSEPADAAKSKGKVDASTESSCLSQSTSSMKCAEPNTGDEDPLRSSDQLQDSTLGGGMSEMSAGHDGKIVICPQVLPPSKEEVSLTASAHELGSVQNKRAFCSNSADLPEKPRLLGGPKSKLQSALVKDLPDFKSSPSETLTSWRKRFAASNRIFSSQNNIEPLWEKLEKDPDFKYILTGDKNCVLTPCKPPPCKKQVQNWLDNKQYSQKHIDKNEEKTSETNTEHELKVRLDMSVDKVNVATRPKTDEPSQQDSDTDADDSSTLVDISVSEVDVDAHSKPVGPMPKDSEVNCGKQSDSLEDASRPSVQIIHMKGSLSSGDMSTGSKKELPLNGKQRNGKSRWDQTTCHPLPPKCQKMETNESSVLHSTPLRQKKSHHLFEPFCSPVESGQEKRKHRRHHDLEHISEAELQQLPPNKEASTTQRTNQPQQLLPTEVLTPIKTAPLQQSVNQQPSLKKSSVDSQLKTPHGSTTTKGGNVSQIDGPTPKNTYGFKYTHGNIQNAKALHEYQYLTVLSMEVHVETRGDLRPDPEIDSLQVLFYSILNDVPPSEGQHTVTGLIIVDKTSAQQDGIHRVLPSPHESVAEGDSLFSSPKPSTSTDYSSPKPSTSSNQTSTRTSSSTTMSSVIPGTSPSKAEHSMTTKVSVAKNKPVPTLFQKSGVDEKNVFYVKSEEELIDMFILLIGQWDPDILVGYEIQMLSWGYVIQRASHLGTNLCTKISRIPDSKESNRFHAHADEWGVIHTSEIHVTGRIVLNLWRLLRHEVTLNLYSFENVAFHVLHQRLPAYSFRTLSLWFGNRLHHNRWRVVDYYLTRAKANIEIINELDLIGKTSEFARVFGIEFFDVLSRGSQYRVESMMLRLAKPMNFIPVSPNIQQRAKMKAGECIPLNLEPESQFYTDPVVVLDFQSLYPSIMIAYNYCFSTCLGRIESLANAQEGPFEFGCTSLNIKPSELKKLEKDVSISPNGVVFLKQSVRRGILPSMVEEILNTRLMIKKSIKLYKSDKTLYRLLNARQLGLKLIANVTYGYTGASYSGRMPCIEVGDSIVRKARESLERSIKLVEDTPHWRARVVYGDTDSMFILLKGRSKDEAFTTGQEIADAVTNMFPKPMKLRFEKVYLPCVLQTKKRYVGFMYETPDQIDPVYDAKGIETVRRDNCGAVAKVLERSIKLLFTSRDVSQVKQYVQQQCNKLMEGKVSIQDCVFAKEYRGITGYRPGACVPALQIARKLLHEDPRAEPRASERVPYVIVYGSPGLPLIQLVRQPLELLKNPTLRINGIYYITKQILPPLNRMFSLLGVDVFTWYQEMPRVIRFVPQSIVGADKKKGTISEYFATTNCPVCDEQSKQPICPTCMSQPQMAAVTLMEKSRLFARVHHRMCQICCTCMGTQDSSQPCISGDCSILFRRVLAQNDNNKAEYNRQILEKALDF